jgi:xylulokinase
MACYNFAYTSSNVISDVRNQRAEKSWDVFNNYLEKTTPLNGKFLQKLSWSFLAIV